MPVKPSDSEEEYFAREEAERRRKMALERREQIAEEERERARTLHLMKCPKCGMQLEEVEFGGVKIDKCFHCEGIWLDKGELETMQAKEAGFISRLANIFRK
jgi:hypothetical protein